MVVVGHRDRQGVGYSAQAHAGKQRSAHGVPEGEACVRLDRAGEGCAQILHGGLDTAVLFHVVGNQNTDDGERGNQHDDTLNAGHLGHGLDPSGDGVDHSDDDGQQDAQVVGVGAGDSGEDLGAGGDLTHGEKSQAESSGDSQRPHDLFRLEPQPQKLLERDGTGAVTQDRHFAPHAAQAIGSSQETGVIDQCSCESNGIPKAGRGHHGAAGHGICSGDHGDGKGSQPAAARQKGGQAVFTALFGLIFDVEAEAHDNNAVNGKDDQHDPRCGRGYRESAQIITHACSPPSFLFILSFLNLAVSGNSSHLTSQIMPTTNMAR